MAGARAGLGAERGWVAPSDCFPWGLNQALLHTPLNVPLRPTIWGPLGNSASGPLAYEEGKGMLGCSESAVWMGQGCERTWQSSTTPELPLA